MHFLKTSEEIQSIQEYILKITFQLLNTFFITLTNSQTIKNGINHSFIDVSRIFNFNKLQACNNVIYKLF